jgi:single-stranded-DNA-specific exonuclease
LSVEQLTIDTIRLLARLEPHGTGNARPLFAVRQAPIKHVSLMKDKHLKFLLKTEGRQEVSAVWWNAMQYLPVVEGKERVSFIASLEINKWKDRETVQLMVKDACVE